MSVKRCSDCGVGMEVGFVPDLAQGGPMRTTWYAGLPERLTLLGIPVGGLRVSTSHRFPVTAYRCPECGVLKFYAEKGE